jgi:hypothetical protein
MLFLCLEANLSSLEINSSMRIENLSLNLFVNYRKELISLKLSLTILTMVLTLIGCSSVQGDKKYSPEEAKENGDVVADYGVVGNVEKLDSFIQNTENKQKAEVKITRFTKEGDPIFIYLKFDGKIVTVKEDASMDQYGGGITKTSCAKVIKEETDEGIRYYLDGCNNYEAGDLLFVPKK